MVFNPQIFRPRTPTRFRIQCHDAVALVCLVFFLFTTTQAGANVSLPLDGYCRVGRFFPVLVEGTDASRQHYFSADGCLPVQMAASANGTAIVPMLVTGVPGELRWGDLRFALHLTAENERLVGITTAGIDQAKSLFPGDRLLAVRLNRTDPLPGPPAGWEALDALVLDAVMFDQITDSQRSALLAGGVILAAMGDHPPDVRWPWQHQAGLWVLKHLPIGPNGDIVNESVYSPTFSWTPGWSPAVRGQAMGAAILIVVGTLAIIIPGRRKSPFVAIGFCILSAASVVCWHHSLGWMNRAGGDVAVIGDGLLQRDSWVFERAKQTTDQSVTWTGSTHPVFSSDSSVQKSGMTIAVDLNGVMAFKYRAMADHTMAFLRRQVQPGDAVTFDSASTESPMNQAATAAYLHGGGHIIGEQSVTNGRWPTVVLQSHQ